MGILLSRTSYESIPDGGTSAPATTTFCKCTSRKLVIIATVCVVAVLALKPFITDLLWKKACADGFRNTSPQFNFLDTDNYRKWYNDDSVMQLAQSGTFIGPGTMIEYVNFVQSTFFESYENVGGERVSISSKKNQCELVIAVQNKAQVKPEYSVSGEGVCLITTVGFKLYYTVSNLKGDGFAISRTNLFYPDKFLPMLFNDVIGGENTTDYICNDVLKDNCQDVYKKNGLDEKKCKSMYDSLPPTDAYGYLDEYTKGCRILHSAFAEQNEKHCPHMSFIPIPDYTGTLWCQKSDGVKAEDLFTPFELGKFKDYAIKSGFDPVTLTTTCPYDPK